MIKSTKQFIKDAKKIHGSRYQYPEPYWGYRRKIGIVCPKHGKFKQLPNDHLNGSGCPTCGGTKSLEWDDIVRRANEIHGGRYGYPEQNVKNTKSRISVICPSHGEFNPIVNNHLRGSGCPTCARKKVGEKNREKHLGSSGDVLDNPEELKEMLSNTTLTETSAILGVSDVTVGIYARKYGIIPHKSYSSREERELVQIISQHGVKVLHRHRIGGVEIDIFIPELNLGIEYCGLYWHSEKLGKDKSYHVRKYEICKNAGIRLMTVFSDEYHILVKMIPYLVGKLKPIGARHIEVRPIQGSVGRNFLINNHTQGHSPSETHLGGFIDETLIGVMSFKKPRSGSFQYELNRFCTDNNHSYPGLASKMFKYFVTKCDPETVVSFSDNRWFEGTLYGGLGFKIDYDLPPDYYYTNFRKRFHKFNFSKSKIKKKYPDDFDPKLSEAENAMKLNLYRIWDCGKKRWLWTK